MEPSQSRGLHDDELFLPRPNPTQDVPIVGPLRIQKPPGQNYTGPTSNPPNKPLPYPDNTMPHSIAADAAHAPRPKFDAHDPHRPSIAGYGHVPTRTDSASPAGAARPSRDSADSSEGLFQQDIRRPNAGNEAPAANKAPDYQQQYFSPPSGPTTAAVAPRNDHLQAPSGGLSRFDSTASVMTTRATRGSPPPPETPIIPPPDGGIEARYAAAGFGRPSAAASSAANQRAAQYAGQSRPGPAAVPAPVAVPAATATPPRQPTTVWTPPEPQGAHSYAPPPLNTGATPVFSPPPGSSVTAVPPVQPAEHALEQDFNRMTVHDDAPPAYSSIQPAAAATSSYPSEKGRPAAAASQSGIAAPVAASAASAAMTHNQGHPAFHNDPRVQIGQSPSPAQSASGYTQASSSPAPTLVSQSQLPASPPPLPEGWIAHLDQKSGQFYYIHLPTQSTQWEFPKGPTPLNLNEPLSPTGTFVNPLTSPISTGFSKQSLMSPGFSKQSLMSPGLPVAQSATVRPDGYLSMAGLASPTAAGFTGPPPTAGVDIYKVQPTNGVYFGPYLKYTNMDLERGIWLGSIMVITDVPNPPTIHIHQSVDLSPNPRQLKANPIYSHQRWIFYRYDVELQMEEAGIKWTYAITSHLGCTRYEFLVAGQHEMSWRFIAHSGNDFAMNVSVNERAKLGGVGYMWKDILQKHIECNGFHCQLGLGDQIFADRMWKEIPSLKEWTAISGKENRKNTQWTNQHEDDVTHAYFHYYTSHFDQPHVREAFAQIPHVLTLDHHDIFDGFGSYPEYMQTSNMFKNIGRIGIEMYLLFQHHTTHDLLRMAHDDTDLFTITGAGWHFIKYLGPAMVVVGPDTRSERNLLQVMAGATYQGLFPKVALLPPSVQHCIWMIPVPVIYPRMESMEHLASTVATGKKMATGTFNMVGKVAGSVAGIVGAKGVVNDGFNSVKKAVGKTGLMSNILNPFGEMGMLDDLRDHWTHESKDLERTYLIRTLQGISHNKSLRMTFLSGDVNVCGVGLVHDPSKSQDHKTMYQIIASPVVNSPPNSYVLRLLHNNKPLYIPQNGQKSTNTPSDTKEDMMEIFSQDPNGQPREMKRLMARRNYVACVGFDPEIVQGAFGATTPGQGGGKLSIAVDFMVQGDTGGQYGATGGTVKYGPVIIPSLEYGH